MGKRTRESEKRPRVARIGLIVLVPFIALAMACPYVVVLFGPETYPRLARRVLWPVTSHTAEVEAITRLVRSEYVPDEVDVDIRSTGTATYTYGTFMDASFDISVPGYVVRYRPGPETPFVEFRTTGVSELQTPPERLHALPSMAGLSSAEYRAVLSAHAKHGGAPAVAGVLGMDRAFPHMLVRREGKEYPPSRCFSVVPVREPTPFERWAPPGDAPVYYLDDAGTVTVLGKTNDLMVNRPR